MPRKNTKLLILFLLFPFISFSQNITHDDYQRAVSFMQNNYNNKTAFNLYTKVNWFGNNSEFWFLDYDKKGKTYKIGSVKDAQVQPFFDHQKIAKELNSMLKDTLDAFQLPLENINKNEAGDLVFMVKGKICVYNFKTKKVKLQKERKEDKPKKEDKPEGISPDGKWRAYTHDYNLFIKSVETQDSFQLTFDGKKKYEYGTFYGWYDKMEGENGDRPKRFWVDWSEDSKWFSTYLLDLRTADKMYLLDWSVDSLFRPRLLSYYRGSPGDTNMVYGQPVFFNVDSKKQIPIALPKNTHINSVSTRWSKESGQLYAGYAERGYQNEWVKKVDLNTQKITTLIHETSTTNIDNFNFWLMEDLGKLIFVSERSGWQQLYTLDLQSKKIIPLTKGNFHINEVPYVDVKNGILYFLASGKDATMNPYHQQLYKVGLNGEVTLLTPEKMHHQVSFSKDKKYFTDNYSKVSIPTRTVVRDIKNGKILMQLTTADVSQQIAKGWQPPQVFDLLAKDGKTTIHGAIWKPTNFDERKSYPIIDATYTGPHTQVFPKSFNRCFDFQSLAELGFIVLRVDGLGTSGRSKAFHNYSYKNMGDNLKDHVLAIEYLGKKYKWIDADRAGIYGHSAGGYDTGRGMLVFPDVYKVGVASSGDHDFRMEKAWWPEMYMGWPVDSSYHEVSNITLAKNLKGKLLLVHGGLDDNVNPSATFKLAEALVKADKEFDLLIFPSQRHGYRGDHRLYFIKKRWNYFVKHLRGVEPIWDFKWE